MVKVSLISLGCPKNLVDSEGALGELAQAGYEIINDASQADVIVVNTCGFIESAKAESIGAIIDALQYKDSGNCKALVVIGCLAQRYAEELAEEMPEVDSFLGVNHSGKLVETIEQALGGKRLIDSSKPSGEWVEHTYRVQSTPPWTAYLKVSDGCDNRCAYCAIPEIRGPFHGRPEQLVVDEAKKLADSGVRELILIGQDLTHYGADFGEPNRLPGLLEKLANIDQLRWIRLMYCYPTRVTPELIEVMASCDKVLKYMDLPLQHGDDNVLRAMNRRGTSDDYLRMIDQVRSRIPEVSFRSTFIVGFPGETDEAFDNLLAFVEKIRFDRVGAFTYSREEGTPAYNFGKRVNHKTAEARLDKLMRLQQKISLKRNRSFVGKQMEVLIEGEDDGSLIGRSYRDAPEIDGLVYVRGISAKPGDFVNVTITKANEYDLISESRNV